MTQEFSPAERMAGIDSSPIRKAFELAKSVQNPVNLSIGQPHFPCPSNILDSLEKAIRDKKTAYTLTAGIPELKNALIEKYKNQSKLSLTEENILITSGVSSALLLLFSSYLNPGERVLLISPYFLMYPALAKLFGGTVDSIPENFTQEEISSLGNTAYKIIIYSSPSNPSGKILSQEQIGLLGELARKNNALLISDEIYETFDYDEKFVSASSVYPDAVVLKGFSKTYSMTGLRLANIFANAGVIKTLTTLQQYTIVCAPSIVQWAGIEALRTDMKPFINDYREKRDFIYEGLKNYYDIEKSGGAFYYFLKIKGKDTEFVEKAVKEKQLILVPGYIFCDSSQFVRISFAAEWNALEKGVKALQELA